MDSTASNDILVFFVCYYIFLFLFYICFSVVALYTICYIDFSILALKVGRALVIICRLFIVVVRCLVGVLTLACFWFREQQHGGRPRSEEPRRDDRRADR